MDKIRVRFAPSPTGPLHLGGVRTALYDYLFAKKNGGDFVLRIEDTDTTRFVEGAEEYIMKSLEWCGIIPDESPKHGGDYGPYRQSERRAIYDQYTQQILTTDYAYIAFDTPEELEKIRKEFEAKGEFFSYNYQTRGMMKNSLSLSEEEVNQLLEEKTPFVVRFKMPFNRDLHLEDIIRGKTTVNTNSLDDKILVKKDGMPTYHFANIIDDHEMKITHIIRGEEWLPSLGLHTLLYEAMGWKAPEFAHLSLILKPQGKGKLSKRDGAKFGFPVFPLNFYDEKTQETYKGYKEEGYLPEAFINFLALLGWSPSDDKEVLSLDEMVEEFDLNKVHKAGARFSQEKAEWFNHQYIQKASNEDLLALLKNIEEVEKSTLSDEQIINIIEMMKERASFVQDIYEGGKFFFSTPNEYDKKGVKRAWKEGAKETMQSLNEKLNTIDDFSEVNIKKALQDFAKEHELGMGKVMMPMRLALVGALQGPDVPVIAEFLGKEETVARINNAINNIC